MSEVINLSGNFDINAVALFCNNDRSAAASVIDSLDLTAIIAIDTCCGRARCPTGRRRAGQHLRGGHPMKSALIWKMPAVVLFLVGSWGAASADTSDVKSPPPLIVGKSGKHCKDDPHCFNR